MNGKDLAVLAVIVYVPGAIGWFVICTLEWNGLQHDAELFEGQGREQKLAEARRFARWAFAAPLWPIIVGAMVVRWVLRVVPVLARSIGRMTQDAFSRGK